MEIAVHKLNSRPRKVLGFKTPYEVFQKLTGIDLTKRIGVALISWIQESLFEEVTMFVGILHKKRPYLAWTRVEIQ